MRGCGSGDPGWGTEAAGEGWGWGGGGARGVGSVRRRMEAPLAQPRPDRGAQGSPCLSAWRRDPESCQRLPPAAGFTGGETEAGREVVSQVLLTCRLLTWG